MTSQTITDNISDLQKFTQTLEQQIDSIQKSLADLEKKQLRILKI